MWWLTLAGCTPEEAGPGPCEGGGEASLAVGDGGRTSFAPWVDGDPVEIGLQGRYGFAVELEVTGLDVTDDVTVFVRYAIDGAPDTEDVGASVVFQCEGEGPAWTGLFTPLADELQTEEAVAALDGIPIAISVSAADAAGAAASADGDYVLSVP